MSSALVEHCRANDPPLEVPPLQEPEERAEFHVTDQKSAEWVLSRIANKKAQLARNKEWIQQEIARTENEIEHLLQRFGSELEQFASEQLIDNKKKSISLPSGVIGFRTQPAKVEVQSEPETTHWAMEHLPAAVHTTLEVDIANRSREDVAQLLGILEHVYHFKGVTLPHLKKAVVNEHFKATGEVPEGCALVPESEKFFIK